MLSEKYQLGKKEMETGAPKNTYGAAPESWKEFYVTFRDIRDRVLSKISSLAPDEEQTYRNRIYEQKQKSFSSTREPQRYLTYHQSVGGSVGPQDAPHLDFEGEHSLMKFFQALEKELGS